MCRMVSRSCLEGSTHGHILLLLRISNRRQDAELLADSPNPAKKLITVAAVTDEAAANPAGQWLPSR